MTLAVLIVMPATGVSASNKAFSNFKLTTTPNTEVWKTVVSKTKPDNEQNWYVTITSQKNLPSSSGQSRAQVLSSDTYKNFKGRIPLPLFKDQLNQTKKIGYGPLKVKKGKTYKLYISGDENNTKKYTITISGRYTS